MSEFMDRARAEAEQTIDHMGEGVWTDGVRYGIYVGVASAAEQEPTDAEIEATAETVYLQLPTSRNEDFVDLPEVWKNVHRNFARAALLAAQKVRAGQ